MNRSSLEACGSRNATLGSWIDSLVIKSIGCFPIGPGINSQHLHGGSQASVTPVLGNLMPSSDLHGHQAHKWCTDTHAGKTHTHTVGGGFDALIGNLFTDAKGPCPQLVFGLSIKMPVANDWAERKRRDFQVPAG